MTQIHTFKKDQQGWAISLPGTIFSRGQRAMVAGADTFLDIIAQGDDEVKLMLATDPHEGFEQLHRTELCGGALGSLVNGANYMIKNYIGIDYNHTMWLCPLTLYIFNYYPEVIYFTKA